jgi:hypothetical protein
MPCPASYSTPEPVSESSRGCWATGLAAAAAVATVVLNAMWMISEGAAPIIAVILIAVALALLLVAGRQFLADAESRSLRS